MEKKSRLVLLVTWMAIICLSCGKDAYDYNKGNGGNEISGSEGEIEFLLNAAYTSTTKTGSGSPSLDVNEFTVEIFNSANVKIKRWEKFSEVSGQKVKLNKGTYKVKAFYGDSTATGFDAVYFAGTSPFQVEGQTTKSISVTCKQANVKMKILWGNELVENYSDYTVKAYIPGKQDSLSFIKTETRSGYIPAGDIKLKIYLTGKDGSKRTYSPAAVNCAPNDFVTLTINTKPATTNEVNVTFSIDSGTDDKVVTITIPAALVVKAEPQLGTSDFDATRKRTFMEGVGVKAEIGINAPGFIQSIVLKTSSPYLASLGWPAQVDLITADAATVAKLKELGLSWLEGVKDKKWGLVDFSQVSKNLRYVAGADDVFTLCITDAYNQTTGDISYKFAVQQANVSIDPVPDHQMWSTKAYTSFTTNVDLNLFKIEGSPDGGSSWIEVPYTILSTAGDTRSVVLNLSPATQYTFRCNYYNGIKLSNTVTGTTENGKALENGNMESWSSTKLHGGNGTFDGAIYCDYVTGWGTRNEKTTLGSEDAGVAFPINYGTNWRWCSGTVSTSDKVEGDNAAEISTLAFYNKAVSGSWKRESVYSYTRDNGTAFAGYLFTGTFDKASDKYTLGIAHDSRPESISFYYKYAPCTDGDQCLAYAVLYDAAKNEIARTVDFHSSGQADYVQQTLSFNYSDKTIKAAYIAVFFKSGESTDITKMHQAEGSYGTSPWVRDRVVGSVLKVDNVKLNY